MFSTSTKYKISNILDKTILSCLILYTLTFLLDIKINFLTTAFAFGIIKLFFIRPKININSKHIYFIALFSICIFLSILFNDVHTLSSINISEYKGRFISPLIGILLVFLFDFTKKRIIYIFSGFSFSLLLNALVVLYQFSQVGAGGRLTGFASSYMLLCAINLLILPIIFTLAIKKSSIPIYLRIFFALTIFINIPAVIIENTRIVYIGIFISFLLIIVLSLKTKKQFFTACLTFLIIAFATFAIAPNSMHRLESITDTRYENQSNSERLLMWQSATNMFIDHPIFGVGIGNYHDQYMEKYRSPLARENQWHPHNVLLDMLSEAGIFGGLGFLLLFGYIYYNTITTWRKTKDIATLAYLSSLLAYTINFFTDSMFSGHNIKAPTTIFYLFTGLYLILNKYIIVKFNK